MVIALDTMVILLGDLPLVRLWSHGSVECFPIIIYDYIMKLKYNNISLCLTPVISSDQ